MKKALLLCFLLSGWILSALGQASFNIDGFSKQYYGKVYFADTSALTSAGWVEVYDRITNKKLIHVDQMSCHSTFMMGRLSPTLLRFLMENTVFYSIKIIILTVKRTLPSWTGSTVAIKGPSFLIYLATENGFQFSGDFTELAQDFCGMFSVDL